ncbi:MAG: hypothetical protein COZ05_05560 [Armatimonadetes bacterium CG_4_10_14_3_um_filter_59_10]|nr:MAG: hypothetical protein COZ05_05560 [Armatimonadetes bacterium CG_4_10_14_3_um_filter_59_10]
MTRVSHTLGVIVTFKGVRRIFDDLLHTEVEVQVGRTSCESLLELAEFAFIRLQDNGFAVQVLPFRLPHHRLTPQGNTASSCKLSAGIHISSDLHDGLTIDSQLAILVHRAAERGAVLEREGIVSMEKKETLGVAVIGLRMGRGHLEGYTQNPHTEIIGVCDPDESLLAQIKATYDAPVAVTDYRELLDHPEIDVVSVASPDYYHAEQCIDAMRAGKDVLCEKPMTWDVEGSKAMVAAVKETGRKFMVGQVCRYAPGFALVKKMVERGEVGELYFVESEYAHTYKHARGVGDWRVDPRREPFLGGGCHAVDLVRWIAGDAIEVSAYANHKCLTDWPVNDCTVAIYKFENNVIGKVMVSIGCTRPYTMRSVFYGTEGTIICDNTSPELQLCSRRNYQLAPSFATFPVEIANHNVAAEIAEFVDCILNDRPVPTNEIQGARTVATALAAAQSAREGRPVQVEKIGEDK